MTGALTQLSLLVHNALAEIAAEHELSIPQLRLLEVLRDGEPTVQELSSHLGLDQFAVTELIDRAMRRGLITRTASRTDRRAYRLAPTCLGHRLVGAVTTRFSERVETMVATLPAGERQRLVRTATRIVAADAARSHPEQ